MRPLLPLALIPAVALVVLTGACDASMDEAFADGCFSSAECLPLQHCILGECTYDRPAFPTDIWAAPLRASPWLPQPVRGVELTPTGFLDVPVHPPRAVTVTSDVDIRASFTAEGETIRPLSFSLEISPSEGGIAEGAVELVDGVVDGRTRSLEPLSYQMTILPTQDACCTEGTGCLAPSVVSVAETDLPVISFERQDTVVLTGELVRSLSDPTPLAGVQVQAFDPDGTVFSVPARTGLDGTFCLSLPKPPFGRSHTLTLRLGPDPSLPTAEIQGVRVLSDQSLVDLERLYLLGGDDLPALRTVEGRITGVDGQPVPGARLGFSGRLAAAAGVEASFSGGTQTDADGVWRTDLYEGEYAVWVQPPPGSPHSRVESTGAVGAGGLSASGLTPLPPRPVVRGRLQDPSGQGLPGARVVARPDSGAGLMEVETLTDGDGGWSLPLDPGAWTFRFEPSAESGLPWVVGRTLGVDPGAEVIDTPPLRTEAPMRLEGFVHSSGPTTMEPLPDFEVEVYGRTPSGRAVLVATARSRADGAFDILLPRSLAGEVGG